VEVADLREVAGGARKSLGPNRPGGVATILTGITVALAFAVLPA
jgi:hypothetical protein